MLKLPLLASFPSSYPIQRETLVLTSRDILYAPTLTTKSGIASGNQPSLCSRGPPLYRSNCAGIIGDFRRTARSPSVSSVDLLCVLGTMTSLYHSFCECRLQGVILALEH